METWIFMVNNGTTGTFNNEGKVIHDFIETATISNKERKFSKHPTQKPIGLYSPLLFFFYSFYHITYQEERPPFPTHLNTIQK